MSSSRDIFLLSK